MAFLTGSYAYGIPCDDSDVDLAVLLTPGELAALEENSDPTDKHGSDSLRGTGKENRKGESLLYGKLNLIIFTDEREYEAWKLATQILKAAAPATRKEAIRVIDLCIEDSLAALTEECHEQCNEVAEAFRRASADAVQQHQPQGTPRAS